MPIMILINQGAKAIFVTINGPMRFYRILYDKFVTTHLSTSQLNTILYNTI
jgi:hypothetical protein